MMATISTRDPNVERPGGPEVTGAFNSLLSAVGLALQIVGWSLLHLTIPSLDLARYSASACRIFKMNKYLAVTLQ